ncbi:MAG: hypothetical protein HY702_07085 [Gemmatimonadetes bacterium]|nr:hypothetical protein [Gemmatimonadota bacterium]
MGRVFRLVMLLSVAVLSWACDGEDVTGPAAGTRLRLAFKVALGGGANPALMAVPLTDAAGNTLDITSAEVVLREIEFERAEAALDCDVTTDEDDCEEVETGPFLVNLPVSATTPVVVLESALPVGVWEEVEFEVHKVSDDNPADLDFLGQNPEFRFISIRVRGTWTPAGGSAEQFTYVSDLNEEQEIEFPMPIVVAPGDAATIVTFVVNMDGWFRTANGALIDPRTANPGGPNEGLVEDNIKNSIEGFEDEDLDGEED